MQGELSIPAKLSSARLGRKARSRLARAVVFIVLIALALPFVAPLLWMLSTSLKTLDQTLQFPSPLIPNPVMLSNYPESMTRFVPLWQYFLNSVFVTVLATFGEVMSSALIAYGFAKFRAPGRRFWFIIVISTILIPYPVYMVPQYILFRNLGWVDTYMPLIVPAFFGSAFLIFLFRQFMQGISNEIMDAARIDGAGVLGTFWRIVLPLMKAALVAGTILSFSANWSNYLGPLLFLNSSEKYTLQLGLVYFIAHRGVSNWHLLMAASVISILPIAITFFIAQRQLVQGIVFTGIK
jgi:multiple sugar transport system permease protein